MHDINKTGIDIIKYFCIFLTLVDAIMSCSLHFTQFHQMFLGLFSCSEAISSLVLIPCSSFQLKTASILLRSSYLKHNLDKFEELIGVLLISLYFGSACLPLFGLCSCQFNRYKDLDIMNMNINSSWLNEICVTTFTWDKSNADFSHFVHAYCMYSN